AGERDRLRETRGLLRLEAVERLLVEQHGNAEARAVLHPALDGVRVLRFRPGSVAFARPLDASDANAKPLGCPGRIEPAVAIGDGPLALPETQHLADLLLERLRRGRVAARRLAHRQGYGQLQADLADLGLLRCEASRRRGRDAFRPCEFGGVAPALQRGGRDRALGGWPKRRGDPDLVAP